MIKVEINNKNKGNKMLEFLNLKYNVQISLRKRLTINKIKKKLKLIKKIKRRQRNEKSL